MNNKAIYTQKIGKVVQFLKEHPLSTCDEVYDACGISVMEAVRWVRQTKYNGKTVWRLNHPKMRREGLL